MDEICEDIRTRIDAALRSGNTQIEIHPVGKPIRSLMDAIRLTQEILNQDYPYYYIAQVVHVLPCKEEMCGDIHAYIGILLRPTVPCLCCKKPIEVLHLHKICSSCSYTICSKCNMCLRCSKAIPCQGCRVCSICSGNTARRMGYCLDCFDKN